MGPLTPAMGGIISAGISSAASMLGGSQANNANSTEARKSRVFMWNMDNTKYQRAKDDLIAAGMNPMLAYMNGPGSTGAPPTAKMEDVITPAVNSANSSRLISSQVEQMDAQAQAALATARNQNSQADLNSAETALKQKEYSFQYGNPLIDEAIGAAGKDNTPALPDNMAFRRFNQMLSTRDLTDSQSAYQKELINEIQPRINNLKQQGKLFAAQQALSEANEKAVRLGLPKIQAESDLYGSAVGEILPLLPHLGGAVNSALGVKSLLKKGK